MDIPFNSEYINIDEIARNSRRNIFYLKFE